jgi:hypothetical protein
MSLLLSGAKTIVFAGTEMQCLEIYTGEAYSIGLNFTDTASNPIDITSYNLTAGVKYYDVDTVVYNDALGQIDLGNITLQSPQGTPPTVTITKTDQVGGIASMFIPTDLTGNVGGSGTPVVPLTNGKGDPSVLVIVSIDISRPDTALPSNTNLSKEPIGFIVRYQ